MATNEQARSGNRTSFRCRATSLHRIHVSQVPHYSRCCCCCCCKPLQFLLLRIEGRRSCRAPRLDAGLAAFAVFALVTSFAHPSHPSCCGISCCGMSLSKCAAACNADANAIKCPEFVLNKSCATACCNGPRKNARCLAIRFVDCCLLRDSSAVHVVCTDPVSCKFLFCHGKRALLCHVCCCHDASRMVSVLWVHVSRTGRILCSGFGRAFSQLHAVRVHVCYATCVSKETPQNVGGG